VTRHPTDAWVAQQRRAATPFDARPRFPLRDNDGKYGPEFDRVATASGIRILRTPVRAPRTNAVCERFLESVLREYASYFNRARPHQGLGQALPEPSSEDMVSRSGPIRAVPVLGGLHHTYRRAA